MYLRHHRDDWADCSSAAKPSEHERSSMVRELLNNIESMKDVPAGKLANDKSKRKEEPTPKSSINQTSSKKIGKVFNMNAEA